VIEHVTRQLLTRLSPDSVLLVLLATFILASTLGTLRWLIQETVDFRSNDAITSESSAAYGFGPAIPEWVVTRTREVLGTEGTWSLRIAGRCAVGKGSSPEAQAWSHHWLAFRLAPRPADCEDPDVIVELRDGEWQVSG
jgi:hypothetical protein